MFHTVLQFIVNKDWSAVGLYFASGGGLAAAIKFFKHISGTKAGHVAMIIITTLVTAMSSTVYYLIKNPVHGGTTFTVKDAAYLMSTATIVYHIVVNPIYTSKVLPFLSDLAQVRASKTNKNTVTPPEPVASTDSLVG